MFQLSKKKIVLWLLPLFVILVAFLVYLPISSFAGIPVLNYHQVNDEGHTALTLSSYAFDAQMAFLKKAGYTAITPTQLCDYLENNASLPANPVLITFDDGYVDNYQVAYPILQKYGLTATIFLISDFVDTYKSYLTWAQVQEMQNSGINFASHTLSHAILTKESNDSLQAQLVKSREALEYRLHQKIEFLAYPGGYYNREVIRMAKEAGYRAAFTINFGRTYKHPNLFSLNRIPIFNTTHTFLHFWLRLKLTQEMLALQNLKDYLKNAGATTLASWVPTF
ncbi:MAG: polysaccharide deacetylase family protein [Pelosinus sp.]|nr:polysaccharide deacetylase family protein [Pelosinus sp.]